MTKHSTLRRRLAALAVAAAAVTGAFASQAHAVTYMQTTSAMPTCYQANTSYRTVSQDQMTQWADTFLCLVNNQRAAQGLPILHKDTRLVSIAATQAYYYRYGAYDSSVDKAAWGRGAGYCASSGPCYVDWAPDWGQHYSFRDDSTPQGALDMIMGKTSNPNYAAQALINSRSNTDIGIGVRDGTVSGAAGVSFVIVAGHH